MSGTGHRAKKRVIDNLYWATALPCRPSSIPIGRPRKISKLEGIRYENAIARALPSMVHGQWFSFQDKNGSGYCQVDLMQIGAEAIVVIEVKRTWLPGAHLQLQQLYKPVVEKAYSRPVIPIVMVQRLTPEARSVVICSDLANAVQAARQGQNTVFHWIGKSAIKPLDPFDPLFSVPRRRVQNETECRITQ